MPITGTDSTLLKAFIKQCKKITSNFDEASLTQLMLILENYLLTNNKEYDINKFEPTTKYYDTLFAFNVIKALKKTNAVYNTFMLKIENSKTKKKKKRRLNYLKDGKL